MVVPPGCKAIDSPLAQNLKALHFPCFRPGLLKTINAKISNKSQHAIIEEAIVTFCNIDVIVLEELNLNVFLHCVVCAHTVCSITFSCVKIMFNNIQCSSVVTYPYSD